MILPPFLVKNDTVAIVSTARKISVEEMKPAIALLESWGLIVRLGKTLGLEAHQFAGNTHQRKTDFQQMLDDPEIKAIWCARGGYGTVKIIDALDFSTFKAHPKWIIGYSDITVLHNHVHCLGYSTLHATMPLDVAKNSKSALNSLKISLFGGAMAYEIKPDPQNRIGIGEGPLVGGNLSILYSLLGSPSAINTDEKILLIEDVNEPAYRIDGMLWQLRQAGKFKNVRAVIFGEMIN